VVGTSPGGELGGTWASPTVDATHSGSSHAGVQSAAEATAAAALAAHVAADVVDGDTAGGVLSGTYPNPGFAADMATQAELDAHLNDTSDAHDASAISVVSTTLSGTGTDVQASLEEIDNLLDDHNTRHEEGGADEVTVTVGQMDSQGSPAGQVPTSDGADGVTWQDQSGSGTVAAEDVSIADVANDFTATNVEDALAELQSDAEADATALSDHLADTSDAHDASAISFSPTGSIAATDTQAAVAEVASEAASALTTHEADTTSVHGIADTSTLYRAGGTDVALADGGTGASLVDPNADRMLFWDDSAGAVAFLAPGTNLTITGTTIDATGGGGSALTVSEDGTPVDATVTTIDFLGADFDVAESPEDEVNVSISSAIARVAAVQPLDATLTALAAANWVANSVPVGSGSDTLSQVALAANKFLARASTGNVVAKDITDFALSLLDDADASTVLGTLGVSTFIKTLLDNTDAATARATLGAAASIAAVIQVPVFSPLTTLAVGDLAAWLVITDDLNGLNLIDADMAVTTVSSSGTPTVQIRNVTDAVDMLTTKITVDASEFTSYTAATQPVIDGAHDDVATGDIIAIDVDVAGTGAKGLIVALSFG